jgi:hypothetical protein
VAIWLRDSPLSEYIRREVLLDVSFTAVNFCALDRETGRLMMIDLTECNDGFQPMAGACFGKVSTTKLPINP